MYGPAPPRITTSSIVRNRTGCQTCRLRKKKCDERKPACNQCRRLNISCGGYRTKLQFRNVNLAAATISPSHNLRNCAPSNQISSYAPPWPREESSRNSAGAAIHTLAQVADECETQAEPVTNISDVLRQNQQVYPFGLKLFYLMAWDHLCGPALAPAFKQLKHPGGLPPVIADTMIAFSAYQLSRKRIPPQTSIAASRPASEHLLTSLEFYGAAMRHIAKSSPAEYMSDPTPLLSVLILFCYLESAMGHFREFSLHSQAIQRIVTTTIAKPIIDMRGLHGTRLMSAWAQTRMHNWWLRVIFSDPETLMSSHDISVGPEMHGYLNIAANRRTFVLSTLCESYRISLMAIIRQANRSPDATVADGAAMQMYHDSMQVQRQIATDWHALVALHDLPIEGYEDDRPPVMADNLGLRVKPVYFNSHTAAMNYAYYVTSRVIQCSSLYSGIPAFEPQFMPEAEMNKTRFWAAMLLRIAAGLNWESCLLLNRHTIGISSLLVACALRCPDLDISLWIEDWLGQRCTTSDRVDEGSILVAQALQMIQLINRKRLMGRDALAIFYAEGGGIDQSQMGTFVLACCRVRDTGFIALRHIPLRSSKVVT